MNRLYYGDNLDVLREQIADSSVDLVYLDPPFNSKRDYNLLFKSPHGKDSHAQIEAFLDTWHWGMQSEYEFSELLKQSNTQVSAMITSFRRFLGETDMMAYLVMMASRLIELCRVLKPTGSLYLHCDPSASHYLKILLDAVFKPTNFKNELIWKRTSGHNSSKRWGPIHDSILFYSNSNVYTWHPIYEDYDQNYIDNAYSQSDDFGHYTSSDLTGAGVRQGDSGKPWRNINPTEKGRHWAVPNKFLEKVEPTLEIESLTVQEKLDYLDKAGLILWPQKGGMPRLKRYLKYQEGLLIQDVITDIAPLSSHSAERLGYPTQKPLALLERIIQASSNKGDIILDPFCGCGTAVHAAQKLDRQWIGIDITHLAISLIEKRLYDAFPEIQFTVEGTPKDLDAARDLANRDKYQFQWWACSLVNAQPYQGKKKGADGGIDGISYFVDADLQTGKPIHRKAIISVKGGQSVGLTMLKDLIATADSNQADIGLFITLADPTEPMKKEALKAGFFTPSYNQQKQVPKIQILTIEDLLNKTHQPQIPDMSLGGLNFKKAQQEAPNHNQQTLF